MPQLEAEQSAAPAGTASAAVISLQSREVSKTKLPTGNASVLAGAQEATTERSSAPTRSNTKPHTQNQDLHDQAVKLLVEIDGSKKKSIDYNKRRRAATAALRPVLTKIWAAFDRGETVGGYAGVKEWCKKIGTITYRRCRQIITGESQAKKVKSLHFLKELIDLISRNAGDAIDKRASEIANLIHYEPPVWKTQRAAEEQAEREAAAKVKTHISRPSESRSPAPSSPARTKSRSRKTATSTTAKPGQLAPVPQKPPAQSPLKPGKKYIVRVAASSGYGIFEPASPVCLQKHSTMDAAWDAIEAVNAVSPTVAETRTSTIADAEVLSSDGHPIATHLRAAEST